MSLQQPHYLERRAFGRRPTNIQAKLRIGYRYLDCIIKDLSEGGARLELDANLDLPARFWLAWDDQPEIVCEVRHQRGTVAGVQFARPIVISTRLTVEPSADVAPPPTTPHQEAVSVSTSAVVADRRARLREANGQADSLGHPTGSDALHPCAEGHALPRDASGILRAKRVELERRAEEIFARRTELLLTPVPLPAYLYAGAVIDPPCTLVEQPAPCPLTPAGYGTIPAASMLMATLRRSIET
ncbi:MAG: PilZ domain-containing protein [Hyphomicrobiaceae bacterium]|nr:PilZ domain-containing protein [Hyphomicrobiaceae bacterium]